VGLVLIEKLLSEAKILIKSGQLNSDTALDFLIRFKLEFSLLIFLSFAFNLTLIFLLKKNFQEIRKKILSSLKTPRYFLTKNEILLPIGCSIALTLITYRNVLSRLFSGVIGFPGDSYNHFARLKESKDLILNEARSYYHWDTIFYPQGLSAFDGDITYYIDFLHLILSPVFSSEAIFNFIMLSSYLLIFTFTYILTRELNQNKLTSLLTSYLVTFSSFHFFSSGLWLNLVNFQFIPLYFFFFSRYLKYKERKNLVGACVSMVLMASSSLIYFFFTHIALVLLLAVTISKKFIKKNIYLFTIPSLSALIVISPWIMKMLNAPEGLKKYFYYPHATFNLDLVNIFKPSSYQFLSFFINSTQKQESIYLGVITTSIIFYLVTFKRNNKLLMYGLFSSLILCLGNFIKIAGSNLPIVTPEIFLSFTPFFKSLRATDRYSIFLLFFFGILVGQFISSLNNKKMKLILVLLLFIDIHPSFKENNFHHNKAPEIYSKIGDQRKPILELPLNRPIYWFWQSYHQHPIVYGYVFSRGKKKQLLYSFLKDIYAGKKINLNLLKNNNISYVILHKGKKESVREIPPIINPLITPFIAKSLSQYFKSEDLKGFRLVHSSKNSDLYKITH
jgi:hypothetical protein